LGKNGSFLGCPNFPKCKFTSNFERAQDGTITIAAKKEGDIELVEEKCKKCDKPMRKMVGKFGEFIACSGYPECKYIKQNIANFPCPVCASPIVERKWRGGTLWGCQNYPKCTFSIFSDIDQHPCPKCNKSLYMIKKIDKHGKITLICPQDDCKHVMQKE
jgi:DNA topoisomerase-1